MYCPHCGTKLEEGDLFCTNCGAKQETAENKAKRDASIEAEPIITPPPCAPAAGKIKHDRKPIILAAAVCIAAVCAVVASAVLFYSADNKAEYIAEDAYKEKSMLADEEAGSDDFAADKTKADKFVGYYESESGDVVTIGYDGQYTSTVSFCDSSSIDNGVCTSVRDDNITFAADDGYGNSMTWNIELKSENEVVFKIIDSSVKHFTAGTICYLYRNKYGNAVKYNDAVFDFFAEKSGIWVDKASYHDGVFTFCSIRDGIFYIAEYCGEMSRPMEIVDVVRTGYGHYTLSLYSRMGGFAGDYYDDEEYYECKLIFDGQTFYFEDHPEAIYTLAGEDLDDAETLVEHLPEN